MANTVKRSSLLTWLVDPIEPTQAAYPDHRFTADMRSWMAPLLIGAALLVASVVGWALDASQFYFSYLIGWVFCLTLAIGAQFFVVIQHLTRAHWSVTVRRIPESLAWAFPVLAILGIPILFGMHDLYHWSHHEVLDPQSPAFDAILAGKSAYLNVPFFIGRLVAYFVLWTFLAHRLYSLSIRQDVDPDNEIPALQRKTSGWGLPVMAVTTAFASYDLLMSLDPHWFSTMFGVYFFGGAFLSIFVFITLIMLSLQSGGMMRRAVTFEHYQDLGKFSFGFVVFWGYIAFSQYMLIWYGNLPEETVWFRIRVENGWDIFSWALMIGQFIVPFWALISRGAKRNRLVMRVMAVWILAAHWLDLYWLAMPVLHEEHARLHWLDFSCWLGLFGVMLGLFMYRLGRHSLLPEHDPQLAKSMRFINS